MKPNLRRKCRNRSRKVKINRCILKPTEEQQWAAYHAVMAWAKQHAALIENTSKDDFWSSVTEGQGILSFYWPTFATKEAEKFAIENGKGQVFAFRYDTELAVIRDEIGIILDNWGLSRKAAKKQVGYRMWLSVERKYLRWVRRHF
jgi:hypothetical protein